MNFIENPKIQIPNEFLDVLHLAESQASNMRMIAITLLARNCRNVSPKSHTLSFIIVFLSFSS